jgi:hypothetical protein
MLKLPLILEGPWATDGAMTSPNPPPPPSELVGEQAAMEEQNKGPFESQPFSRFVSAICNTITPG